MNRSHLWTGALALILLLAACNREPTPVPTPAATPMPPVSSRASGGMVKASASVVPVRKATLSFPVAGRVMSVDVTAGDEVKAGQALMSLDATASESAVEEARSALFQRQASLEALVNGPRPPEIEAAQARLDAAKARLAQFDEPARAADVEAAKAELAAAQAAYRQLFAGPRASERIAALADLSNARAALQQAQSAYNQVAWRNDVAATSESRQLQQATNNLEAAQARYDALFARPDADVAAAALARVKEAQAVLDRLQSPGGEHQIAEAEAQVRSAQAEFDLLTAGARDEDLAAAAVAVTQAEAVLHSAEAALADLTLRAPFTGTVTTVDVDLGERVRPGQGVVTVADLSRLRVETTDLSERDVVHVAVGQPVTVFVDALGSDLAGRVERISPQAQTIGGDVVYPVVIELDEQQPGLRWGMSAEVEIER
jgi:multidrug efflux pump subunit AcrA (membrane-fusion protein)